MTHPNIIPAHRAFGSAPLSADDPAWQDTSPAVVPEAITPDLLNTVINALLDSELPHVETHLMRFLMRVGYELDLANNSLAPAGSRYMFSHMHLGERVPIPRADEHRVRQALSRFRAKQPYWRFTLRVSESDPYTVILTRVA